MPIEKITRDAFLYLEPRSKRNEDEFSQCATCPMWMGEKKNLCSIHGNKVEVRGSMTCALYIEGAPDEDQEPFAFITPEQSGLEDREVRCENCRYLDGNGRHCNLYHRLNTTMPFHFDLNVLVKDKGCCNANKA